MRINIITVNDKNNNGICRTIYCNKMKSFFINNIINNLKYLISFSSWYYYQDENDIKYYDEMR